MLIKKKSVVLDRDDEIYKSLNTDKFLSVLDIPKNIVIQNSKITLHMLSNITGVLFAPQSLGFTDQGFLQHRDVGSG